MSWAIRVENLGKQYHRGEVRFFSHNLREVIMNRMNQRILKLNPLKQTSYQDKNREEFWAIKNINLEVKEGEVIGIVGRNGAGKSTLLKILSRITRPTTGSIRYRGRMASLLEIGTGFHGELTGRENIILNGGIMGMRRMEVVKKIDEIVAFSEVGSFLDTPVKFYSSGMYLRLAFAVAAHLEPELMVIDEVLAVGDASFQKKCLGKMSDVARSGRTILFVSHNMGAIAELCNRAILLHQGEQCAEGKVADVLAVYSRLNRSSSNKASLKTNSFENCSVTDIKLLDDQGNESTHFDITENISIQITYKVRSRIQGLQMTVTLDRNMMDVVHSFDTDDLSEIPDREPGLYCATYFIPKMFLKSGVYNIRITAGTPDRLMQNLDSILSFEIEELSLNTHMKGYRRDRSGHVISPGKWKTIKLE
jgi:lipopolysaccharide transport system ATP-binding protein